MGVPEFDPAGVVAGVQEQGPPPSLANRAAIPPITCTEEPPVVVLTEGRSDVAALTALLRTSDIADPSAVSIVDMGGVTNIRRHLAVFTEPGRARRILGLCDADEQRVFAKALASNGVPSATRADMSRYGFQVCDADLEDELIRTLGAARVLDILDQLGLAHGFARFSQQMVWRNADVHARLHRFAGIASGRKIRLAGALGAAIPWARLRPPLRDLVEQIHHALSECGSIPLQRFPDR
jgi:hypothetical protein